MFRGRGLWGGGGSGEVGLGGGSWGSLGGYMDGLGGIWARVRGLI